MGLLDPKWTDEDDETAIEILRTWKGESLRFLTVDTAVELMKAFAMQDRIIEEPSTFTARPKCKTCDGHLQWDPRWTCEQCGPVDEIRRLRRLIQVMSPVVSAARRHASHPGPLVDAIRRLEQFLIEDQDAPAS